MVAIRQYQSVEKAKGVWLKAASSILYYTNAIRPLRSHSNRSRLEKKRVAGLPIPWSSKRRTKIIQIFTYHRVNDDCDPFLPATPTKIFARQMKYLAAHYNICDANDLKRFLENDDVPERAVVITFDDGYRDFLLNAFPVLKELGITATVFLPTAFIGTGRMLWYDQVAHAFRETRRTSIPALEDNGTSYSLESLEQRVAAFEAAVRFLYYLDTEQRFSRIDRLFDESGVQEPTGEHSLMLTWDDVRALQADGISFGSHTVSHAILSRLSPKEAVREIKESKKVIEAELKAPVRLLAYPNGLRDDFSAADKEAARAVGYDCALTTIFGVNQAGQDLFELRRGGPWDAHLPSFALRLAWYRLTS